MNLKTYLRKHKLSQSEFARQVGVTQGAVWQWLEGKQRISAEKALLIEGATGGVVSRQELRADLWPRP
jgi:DNA-binding transcriptional regulator YdaS (Cro superfamily)